MSKFKLPDLGEGLQEAEIVAWHISAGDRVSSDQPLLSVETDKAVVEIPAPHSGRIAKLLVKAGDIVKIGAPLVEFEDVAGEDSGTVVGDIPTSESARAETVQNRQPASVPENREARVKATPAVRIRARELGVNLRKIEGSGPGGTISISDIEEAAAISSSDEIERLPIRGVRRAMAIRMAEAHRQVVPATVTDIADVQGWTKGTDVTLRLVRAIVAACVSEPSLNAWYLGLDEGRQLHDKIDLGIAMDTEDGLFVPVLRDVGNRSPADLRLGLEAMKKDVRARKVPLSELRGQTITLSNFGMFGGQHAALVVQPPQVAIIGAGRIHPRVVVASGKPAVRRTLPISLTFDHRAVMGGEAARFLMSLINDLESNR